MQARDPACLEELHAMFLSNEFLDMEFFVDEESFKAHRVMLCAVSSYFRKLLAGEFQEGTHASKAISMEAYTPETFRMILEYLYHGTVTAISCCNAKALLWASCASSVLSATCYPMTFVLDGHIDNTNVCDLLLLKLLPPWLSG